MSKAKKKRESPQRQAYRKQLANIRRFMSRAESRGFRFTEISLPNMPKRVTKQALAKLKTQFNPTTLYEQATYLSPGGKIVSGTEGRKLERSFAAKKSAQTRKQRLKRAQQIIQQATDDEVVKNVPIRKGPYLIDSETGEIIADESNNVYDAFLEQIQKFDSVDDTALPNRQTLIQWFLDTAAQYGEKFYKVLKELQDMGIGITYQTMRYQEQLSGFLISVYRTFARLGYMKVSQADAMIEHMQDIQEWDDENVYY